MLALHGGVLGKFVGTLLFAVVSWGLILDRPGRVNGIAHSKIPETVVCANGVGDVRAETNLLACSTDFNGVAKQSG